MKELINIQDQQFFYASVDELLNFSSENKCAVIIDETHLKELVEKGIENLKEGVSQIIIISENVNAALPNLIGVEVFLMAANGFEQAVRFAMQSAALNNVVVCVVDHNQDNTKQLIEMVVV